MANPRYITVDVFTDQRFTGNPLAVFPDAHGLSDAAMQDIAREFNYSEVTFVLPPEDPQNSARVRIFTPTTEIPFAGHPNVGTAFVLGRQEELFGKAIGDALRFEEKAGLVDIALRRENGVVIGSTIRAPRPLTTGRSVAAETVARCASIDVSSVRLSLHEPLFASVGLPFVLAELGGLEALAAARPNAAIFAEAATGQTEGNHDFSLFLYVRNSADPWAIRARMFAPLDNVTEDPATGSASAALAAYLVARLPEADTEIALTIEQGVEMGRRSIIALAVRKSGGEVTDVRISGRCVEVMQGSVRA